MGIEFHVLQIAEKARTIAYLTKESNKGWIRVLRCWRFISCAAMMNQPLCG